MVTINQIRKYFSDFAAGHFQIKDFGYGDFPDVSMERAMEYTLMWVQPKPWTIEGNEILMGYTVAIADRVYKERGEQETEVHSDTALIALDLLASLNQQQDYDWELNQQATATPFTEAWKDEVAGHMIDLTFKIEWNYDACQIPQTGQPAPPPTSCAGVIITINEVLYGTIASGDTETIEVRNSNGVLVGSLVAGIWVVPAAGNATAVLKNSAGTTISTTIIPGGTSQDLTAPDASAVIKDSAGATLKTEAIPSNVSENITINDSVAVLKNSLNITILTENIKAEATENIPIADVSWTDSDSSPQTTPYGNAIVCTPATPASGAALYCPIGQSYTSFRTGDEGSRLQAGYFNYSRPAHPVAHAELDMTLGINYWWRLKTALAVAGVLSTIRFVDVDGGQTWSATGDKNRITIDKLTGIGFYRLMADIDPVATWNNCVDNALTFSTVVNGITYDTWYLASLEELELLFAHKAEQPSGHIEDEVTVGNPDIYVKTGTGSEIWSSTTQRNNTANAYSKGWNPETYIRGVAKTATFFPFFVFDAKSLITA